MLFIVGVIALRHLPTLLNVDVDVDVDETVFQEQNSRKTVSFKGLRGLYF